MNVSTCTGSAQQKARVAMAVPHTGPTPFPVRSGKAGAANAKHLLSQVLPPPSPLPGWNVLLLESGSGRFESELFAQVPGWAWKRTGGSDKPTGLEK